MRPLMRREVLAAAAAPLLASDGAALKDIAARRGVAFGSEVLQSELSRDPAYAALVARECALLVPGLEAKWDHTEATEGVFDFAALDWIFDWAARHGQAVRLHTLVWGLAMPAWLPRALQDGRGDDVLHRHVAAVAGRYAGRTLAWDVVNEVSDPRWAHGPEGLTLGPWRNALGAGYVAAAFRLAAAADPQALRFINDDDLEYDEPDRGAKRATYLRLIEGWLRDGAPLQGFGLQAHLKPERPFAAAAYRRFLAELAGMGLVLHITELDVQDHTLPADLATRDRRISDVCRRYLDVALDERAVRAVLVWGLSSRYTYQTTDRSVLRSDGLEPRGLAYDRALRPTPLRAAIADALGAAPLRG